MAQPIALLMDMLGLRARWHSDGREGAEAAFAQFESIIAEASRQVPPGDILLGHIETDSALFICESYSSAIKIARYAYRKAFSFGTKWDEERIWLRGAIVPHNDGLDFRTTSHLENTPPTVTVSRYSPSVFDLVAIEKAGFKGMRLLVRSAQGTGHGARRSAIMVKVKGRNFAPFLRLHTPPYPGRLSSEKFHDFAWMASDDEEEASQLRERMTSRLRWAAGNAEEFVQAAATQVLFNHWDAFVKSVKT